MSRSDCISGHSLLPNDGNNHFCDICRVVIGPHSDYFCQSCNFDLCSKCINKCSGRHPLNYSDNLNNAFCDVCGTTVGTESNHSCRECNYDICESCYHKSNLNKYGR
jgi:hypothetical protein